jgi:hypothetical protein
VTPAETASTYPGDDLVPDAEGSSTMATTLPAAPETVCPWLVQMGIDRAGWYSWDRFDHGGKPSADRIVPEWQDVEEGQRLIQAPDGSSWFTVAALEPNRTLVLRTKLRAAVGSVVRDRARPAATRVHGGGLGLPSPADAGRRHPSGGADARQDPPAVAASTVRPALRGARALHHADPAVPQPARPGQRPGQRLTSPSRTVRTSQLARGIRVAAQATGTGLVPNKRMRIG